jgi:FkbH-like protein
MDALRELQRSGRLAAEYSAVAGILAGLAGDELQRAGQLLARLDPDAVLAANPGTPVVSVALTGHGTLGPLVPSLAAELARHGLLLRVHVSDFDSYVFDLSDPQSALRQAGADLVLCVLDPAVVTDDLAVPWRPDDVAAAAERRIGVVAELAARFEAAGTGTLVLNTLPLPRALVSQLRDHRSRARLGAIWREANVRLLRLAEAHRNVVVLDLDPLVASGAPAQDPRLDVYAKVHLGPDLLAAYAREVGHLARHVAGRTKKVLVLDLDETLWGGTLGDDGAEGIEIGEGYRGEAFSAFQRVVKQIGSQGVLLAAVSKNDLEPVQHVFRDHPRMTLREADFVRVIAGWGPKHESIVALAESLNLGVDGFVFADDNPHECELVRRKLPGVAVLTLDGEPALHTPVLLRDGWFDGLDVTEEDRARTVAYREELSRRDFLDSFESIEDYLRELAIEVTLASAGEPDVARLSQLTLRTNQFNLTTRRLQAPDVRRLLDDPAARVLTIRARDRFGDSGMVGAVFTRRAGDTVDIENFVLSCRVFSRGIEQACLSAVLRHARAGGATAVTGTYRPTAKNRGVRDLYPRHGFALVTGDAAECTYRHDLADIVPAPGHIVLHTDFGGRSP